MTGKSKPEANESNFVGVFLDENEHPESTLLVANRLTRKKKPKVRKLYKNSGRPGVITVIAIQVNGLVVNALVDSGAATTIISEWLATRLNLPTRQTTRTLQGIGGKETRPVKSTEFVIGDYYGNFSWRVMSLILKDPCGTLRPVEWNTVKVLYEHLANIEFTPVITDRPCHIIIGNDLSDLMTVDRPDVVSDQPGQPYARHTRLGWMGGGPLPSGLRKESRSWTSEDTNRLVERLAKYNENIVGDSETDEEHPSEMFDKKASHTIHTASSAKTPDEDMMDKLDTLMHVCQADTE